MYPGNGHLLASLLALALLALISPSTTTAFKLQGKRTTEVVEPDVSKPSFELCNFPAVLLDINYPFILTALSDDLPVRSWPILLRFPSDTIPQSLYISRSGISQPLFILNGNLSTGGTDGRLTPAKIQSTSKSSKSLFFGGKAKGEYPDWWTTRSCDAQGRPFTELKTTQQPYVAQFKEGEKIFVRDPGFLSSVGSPKKVRFQISRPVEETTID